VWGSVFSEPLPQALLPVPPVLRSPPMPAWQGDVYAWVIQRVPTVQSSPCPHPAGGTMDANLVLPVLYGLSCLSFKPICL
jgi:hypothetical protein